MKYYYSPTTKGFYSTAVHTAIPSDVIAITDEQYTALMYGLSHGKQIVVNGTTITLEDIPAPTPVPDSDEVIALRNKYKESTRAICALAGVPVVDKLEDSEYETVLATALANNAAQASILAQTTMYTLFQLYRLDPNDTWNRI